MATKNSKVIFHIDIDSFFVGAELTLRPELKNKDISISPGHYNSVVCALSYSAKYKGAKVPMKLYEVKKFCPNIINLKPNFFLYNNLSNKIFSFLKKNYSNLIEIGSIDEWFIDVTNIWRKYKNVKDLALDIQKNIKNKFNLEVSIGISYNKFLAKLSTDLNKPLGISIVSPKDIKNKIWPLNIEKYWGIGDNLKKQLIKNNVLTIGDIAKIDENNPTFKKIFKNKIKEYINNANGISSEEIKITKNNINTINNSIVFLDGPTEDYFLIYNNLKTIVSRVEQRLIERCLWGKKLILGIKFKKNQTLSISKNLEIPINDFEQIYYQSSLLLNQIWNGTKIIGLSLSLSDLANIYLPSTTQSLFTNNKIDNKNINVQNIIENINNKFGKKVSFSLKEYQENKSLSSLQMKYLK